MSRLTCSLVVSLAFATSSICQDQFTLELRVPQIAALGDAIPIRLAFTNRTDEATYLQFSGEDYGAESLVVCASKDGRWYRTGQIHFDRDVGAGRLDFVPLGSEQTFETSILDVNTPRADALPILRLPQAGNYEIFARYTSVGPTSFGPLWPIWRGVVTSPFQTLTLMAPVRDVLVRRRAELSACVSESDACAPATIGFFRVVPDDQAAGILVKMLDHAAIPDPALIEAVANQAGDAPKAALRRFTSRLPGSGGVEGMLDDGDDAAFVCGSRAGIH